VEAWTTALALAPNHEPSRQALKRLRGRIDRALTEHLRRGWHALAREDAAEARRHFLTALALDPDSRAAQEALRATPAPPGSDFETRTTRSAVRPAVRSGETQATGASPTPTPLAEPGGGASPEAETPGALYAAARAHLAARDHDRAYRALVQLDHVSPGYRDSARLLRALRPRLARQRYQNGLRLFREELLEDAIEQWRAVLEIDPAHRLARRNIEQAEQMLRTLAAQPKR
jgi:tetratricopeptide (TPR) repeat protein